MRKLKPGDILPFLGPFGEIVKNKESENPNNFKNYFFKPFSSLSNFGIRVASIPVPPILFLSFSILNLCFSLFLLTKALFYFLSANTSLAKKIFKRASDSLEATGQCLIVLPFSPLINLIDLIGGIITTLSSKQKEEPFSYSISISPSPSR